jgi:hypothetical protein
VSGGDIASLIGVYWDVPDSCGRWDVKYQTTFKAPLNICILVKIRHLLDPEQMIRYRLPR